MRLKYKQSLREQGLKIKGVKKRETFIHQTTIKEKSKNEKSKKSGFDYKGFFDKLMQEINGSKQVFAKKLSTKPKSCLTCPNCWCLATLYTHEWASYNP